MKRRCCVYQLRITLQGIRPSIWRLVQVPNTLLLCCLHDVLQAVMGWTDSHLHQFEKDGKYWGVPEHFEDVDMDILDERQAKITDVLKAEGDSVLYVYDLGDDWQHKVVLDQILPAPDTRVGPVCLAGERHCPPEDVGGTTGYEEFLEVIFDPGHEEYQQSVRWASAMTDSAQRFQPEEFDVKAVNSALSRVRCSARHHR